METYTKSHPNLMIYQEKIVRRLHQYTNRLMLPFLSSSEDSKAVFIMGYGRSGTTMLLNSFERDFRIDSLGENDQRIAENYLLIYHKVAPVIKNSKKNVVAMKPILNSFDALHVLREFESSKIIWMIRDHRDVVASAFKSFQYVVPNYMKQLVQYGSGDNWLAKWIPHQTLRTLQNLNFTYFTFHDWLALVWWAVNKTIILDKLYLNDHFLLMPYERLVKNIDPSMKKIYEHIGLDYKQIVGAYMHSGSVSKGKKIVLDNVVNELCGTLSNEITLHCSK